jgi:hypothetical protein
MLFSSKASKTRTDVIVSLSRDDRPVHYCSSYTLSILQRHVFESFLLSYVTFTYPSVTLALGPFESIRRERSAEKKNKTYENWNDFFKYSLRLKTLRNNENNVV